MLVHFQQFFVPSALDYPASRHHKDLVCRLNGAQPVRDDDARAARQQSVERSLDAELCQRIHRTGRFV